MTQLTLRNVPDSVKHKIQLLSRQRGQSMNAAAISLLQESLGLKPGQQPQRDLGAIFGCWDREEAEQFEENIAVFEQIDETMWGENA